MAGQLDSFLKRVHRRWTLWRVLEHAAIGVLGGCAFAAIVGTVAYSRGDSALPFCAAGIVPGAAVGALLGWIRRPSILQAAMEADRQLHLKDLLSTALSAASGQTIRADGLHDAWSGTLQTLAEARCVSLSPSDLMLRRLSPRAWGGVGLAAAMVLTLGVISSNPLVSRAGLSSRGSAAVTPAPAESARASTDSPSSADGDDSSRRESAKSIVPASDDPSTVVASASSAQTDQTSSVGKDGSGGGAGRTEAHPRAAEHPDNPNLAGRDASAGGAPVGGAGTPDATAQRHQAGGGTVSNDASTRPAAPWRAASWSADQQAANQALEQRKIPDEYRKLVRDYFAR
jgi:hypothetical protein